MSALNKTVFHNPDTGETFVHRDRDDGKRDLKFGETGSSLLGHAVFGKDNTLDFLRETDGRVVADDRIPQ
jgi:hypothetical protein